MPEKDINDETLAYNYFSLVTLNASLTRFLGEILILLLVCVRQDRLLGVKSSCAKADKYF